MKDTIDLCTLQPILAGRPDLEALRAAIVADQDQQPALPGAESVRETEHATPAFDVPFSLTAPAARTRARTAPRLPELD